MSSIVNHGESALKLLPIHAELVSVDGRIRRVVLHAVLLSG